MEISVIPVTPFQQNCSILKCESTGKGAVVDPGGEVDRILAGIEAGGIVLDKILVTHAHLDHAGAAADLASKTGVPIVGPHRDDQFLIDMLPEQGRMFGVGGDARSFEPNRWLEQGDDVQVGELSFEVRHCPGHTPGHVVFVSKQQPFALVGDVLFQGSIGRTDLPRGDHATLLKSIREQLLTLDDEVQFLSGHGPTSTIGNERRSNPFL